MLLEIREFDGVQKADLMPRETPEPRAKGMGGFLIGFPLQKLMLKIFLFWLDIWAIASMVRLLKLRLKLMVER